MRVCSGPRVNSATFFEDVLEITRSVRAKEKKGAARAKQEPIPASSSIVSSSIATKPLRCLSLICYERNVRNTILNDKDGVVFGCLAPTASISRGIFCAHYVGHGICCASLSITLFQSTAEGGG